MTNNGVIMLSHHDLVSLLQTAAEAGAAKVAAMFKPAEDLISQREACRRYGRGTVERWVSEGKVAPRQVGGKRLYSASQLQSLCRALEVADIIVSRQSGGK